MAEGLRERVQEKWEGRKARREPSGFAFGLADTLGALDPAAWDAVTAEGSVFLRRPFLRAWEGVCPEGMALRYALVYRGPRPVAALVVQVLEVSASQLVARPEEPTEEERAWLSIEGLKARALDALRWRIMVCGSMATSGPHGVAVAPGEDPAELWPAVADGLYRIRRADKLFGDVDYVVVKDLPQDLAESGAPLERYSYRRVELDPKMAMVLDPAWGGLDDYLAALHKKYRKSLRGTVKKIDAAGIEVRRLEDVQAEGPRLHALYRAVLHRAAVRPVELPEGFFPGLAEALGPEGFTVPALVRDGEILGYATCVRDGDTAVGFYVGVDYEANADLPVYHRLLLCILEQGMEWGCTRVFLGATALEAKARLGCKPEASHVWVRHRVPLVNVAVRRLFRGITPAEAPERNPLKGPPADG